MKALITILGFSLLVGSVVNGLKCYGCETSNSWDECYRSEIVCPKSEDTCMKAEYSLDNVKYYQKDCTASINCNATEFCGNMKDCEIHCCNNEDLCNAGSELSLGKLTLLFMIGLMSILHVSLGVTCIRYT